MMNWKKNLKLGSVVFFLMIIACSCDPKVTKEGIRFLQEFRRENRCYEYSIGQSTAHAIKGLKKGFYSVTVMLKGCYHPYQYSNDELYRSDSLAWPIAEKIFLELKNKELYDGILISFEMKSISSYYIYHYYEIKDDQINHILTRRGNH